MNCIRNKVDIHWRVLKQGSPSTHKAASGSVAIHYVLYFIEMEEYGRKDSGLQAGDEVTFIFPSMVFLQRVSFGYPLNWEGTCSNKD